MQMIKSNHQDGRNAFNIFQNEPSEKNTFVSITTAAC